MEGRWCKQGLLADALLVSTLGILEPTDRNRRPLRYVYNVCIHIRVCIYIYIYAYYIQNIYITYT